jgi:hypothetical protein
MNATSKVEASLASAMAAAFAEIEAATKSANNPHFKSKYADLGAIIEAVKPPLIAHGLFFTQRCHPCDTGVSVETVVHHSSGEELSLGTLFVPANKNDAQGFGSALTYARRYALVTAFGVPVEDDDGNAAARASRGAAGGHSEEGAVSPRQQSNGDGTGHREKLAGPYTSITQLKTAVREFVRTLQGCGDDGELRAFLDTKDARELIEQVKRDMMGWWEGWPDQPPEFVPLHRQIEMKEYEMAQQIADIARA